MWYKVNEMGGQDRIIDTVAIIIIEYTTDHNEVLYILRKVKEKCMDDVFEKTHQEEMAKRL